MRLRSVLEVANAYRDGLGEFNSIELSQVGDVGRCVSEVFDEFVIEAGETIDMVEFSELFYRMVSSTFDYQWPGSFSVIEELLESGESLWDIPFEEYELTSRMVRKLAKFREIEDFVVSNRVGDFIF